LHCAYVYERALVEIGSLTAASWLGHKTVPGTKVGAWHRLTGTVFGCPKWWRLGAPGELTEPLGLGESSLQLGFMSSSGIGMRSGSSHRDGTGRSDLSGDGTGRTDLSVVMRQVEQTYRRWDCLLGSSGSHRGEGANHLHAL